MASVTPTSRFCMAHVCRPINFDRDLTIVEYGAGTGVFANYLLPDLSSGSKMYLFETNPLLFEKLQAIDDSRVFLFDQSVEFVTDLLPDDLIGATDYIISGIPFSFLDGDTRASVLQQSVELLREGGQFLAYQTSGHLKEPLQHAFGNVQTEWEWRNIPPMTVYQAVKERPLSNQ